MTPHQNALVERIRVLFGEDLLTREVSMFGGRSFMVNERLIVSVGKTGDLLVRIDACRHQELLRRPGATQAMMATKDMGPGWIEVSSEAIQDDAGLRSWIDLALEYNRSLPPRVRGKSSRS